MNWGKKLLISYVIFCSLLSLSVYRLVKETKVNLVSRQYRQEEKNYQQVIEARQRAADISAFRVKKVDPFIVLQVPEEHLNTRVKGEIFFHCVYDEKLDMTIQMEPDDLGQQIIPQSWIMGKRYRLKLKWTNGKDSFYTEHELNMNN
jgi:hypothetical protein